MHDAQTAGMLGHTPTSASVQNATTVATTSLDDLVAQTIADMAAAAVVTAAAQQNDTSVFPTAAAYNAELLLIAANAYTLEQNFQRRHGADCGVTLTQFNRGPTNIAGVVLPSRRGSAPEHDTGINSPSCMCTLHGMAECLTSIPQLLLDSEQNHFVYLAVHVLLECRIAFFMPIAVHMMKPFSFQQQISEVSWNVHITPLDVNMHLRGVAVDVCSTLS